MINGIIFGGKSYEHEISIVSAITVLKKLSSIDTAIFVDTDHTFYAIPLEKMQAKFFASKAYRKMPKVTLAHRGFVQKKLFGSTAILDKTFVNMVHGADGEDGTLASMLDFYEIRYIGPRTAASVMSYDKYLTKMYAHACGVKTLDYYVVGRGEKVELPFGLPVIVKPLTLGSSIGISIVRAMSELEYALDVAFEYDEKVIIEPFIEGVKEYNQAGTWSHEGWHLSIIEEPQKGEFLDFEKKYLDFSRSGSVNSASLDNAVQARIQEQFKKIYGHYFRGALIRCDFFVIEGEVYLNEINPIPGSMANYLFEDFVAVMQKLSTALPHPRDIRVSYNYIHQIHAAKGK